MRVLLVEDEIAAIEAFHEVIREALLRTEILVARSRDSALACLNAEDFDAVVCDLRIPSSDGALDQAEEYGLFVIRQVVDAHRATPVLVLSGFATLGNIGELVNRPERDIYGTGSPIGMVKDTPKTDYSISIAALTEIAQHLDALRGIAVVSPDLDLRPSDERALQVYVRKRHGALARVQRGTAGLSGALTATVELEDQGGRRLGAAFVKIDDRLSIDNEERRYEQHVAGVLPPGAFASMTGNIASFDQRSGLFYGLIHGEARNLFEVLASDSAQASRIVARLEEVEAIAWLPGASTETITVGVVRATRGGLEDHMDRDLVGLDWRRLEAQPVEVRSAVQHCDLHGANVLINGSGQAYLVDFAQTGLAFVSLDPIQLELSLWFHEGGRAVVGPWPSPRQLESWADLAKFSEGSPRPQFVSALRGWAGRNGAGPHVVLANAYGHAVRQLNYADVDPKRVRAMVSAVISAW